MFMLKLACENNITNFVLAFGGSFSANGSSRETEVAAVGSHELQYTFTLNWNV